MHYLITQSTRNLAKLQNFRKRGVIMKYEATVVITTTWIPFELIEADSESEAHDYMVRMLSCHDNEDLMGIEDESIDIYIEEVDEDDC